MTRGIRAGLRTLTLAMVFGGMAFSAPAPSRANMANPSDPGDVIGEPSGDLRDLAIEHEELAIDLRPLTGGQPAEVSASYSVRNDGPEKTVELVFVATSLTNTGSGPGLESPTVTLDGVAVDYRIADGQAIAWPPPSTTPGIGGTPLRYEARQRGQLLFSMTLSPGSHSISVIHRADPSRLSGNSPTVYWQLGYVLSPARQWASFGTLDVSVQVPPGWRAASEPQLVRRGDELSGTFQGIPADGLALTVQMPAGGEVPWPPIAMVLVVVAAALVGWQGGKLLGRRGRSPGWFIPLSVVFGVVAMLASVWFAVAGESARFAGIPAVQIAWTYGYGSGIALVLLAPVVGLVAGILSQVAAWIAATRARRSA